MTPGCLQGAIPRAAPLAEAARIRTSLSRIAKVLGVPVSAFFPDAVGQDDTVLQMADLVTVFAGIENPAARRTCLAFVRAMAKA